jgi:hypothetical protein
MDRQELIKILQYFGIEYDKDDDYNYLMEGGK